MEEPCIEGGIIAIRRQAQQINVRLGNGQIIVIARLVDQRKDAIGDTNCIEDQEETTGLEQDPFHVRLAGKTFSPAGQVKKPRYILRAQTTDDEF